MENTMKEYTEVYHVMGREDLWEYIISVVRNNNISVEGSSHGYAPSDLWYCEIEGPKKTRIKAIVSERKEGLLRSQSVTMTLEEYVLDLVQRMSELSLHDLSPSDGASLSLIIDEERAEWSEYTISEHEVIAQLATRMIECNHKMVQTIVELFLEGESREEKQAYSRECNLQREQ
jgi:hypothetical protein